MRFPANGSDATNRGGGCPREDGSYGIESRGLVAGRSLFPIYPVMLSIRAHPSHPYKFHWNDYSDRGYLVALQLLQDLQREGLISALGLCNFDAVRMDEICTSLGPDSIVSNQIQVRSRFVRLLHRRLRESHSMKAFLYVMHTVFPSTPPYTLYGPCLDPDRSISSSSRLSTPGHCTGWWMYAGSIMQSY